MRRLLSTAVQVRPAPTLYERITNPPSLVKPPSEAEMGEAVARLTRDLEDMRLARTDGGTTGWEATDDFAFTLNVTGEGEVIVRGSLVIERKD